MRLIRAFSAMSSLQQGLILGFSFLLLLLLILFSARIFMTSYVPLYSALTPNQMVSVIEQLNKDEVDYRIHDSNTIVVPEAYLLQERKRMTSIGIAGDKIPKEKRSEFSSTSDSSYWINPLLYSVVTGIGLFFLLSIWSRVRYNTQHLRALKTDVDERNTEKGLSETVENLNELQVPTYSGYEALTTALEKRIELRKDDVAVLIDALLHRDFETKVTQEYQLDSHLQTQYLRLSRVEKIAFVLGQLDAKVTASIFELMRPKRMHEIALVISEGIIVDRRVARALLEEFALLMQSNPYVKSGSYAYVKEVLYHALDPQEAERMMSDLTMIARRNELFSWLATVRPVRLAEQLRNEHPQTIALILAHFDETVTAGVLEYFSEPLLQEILERIARLTTVSSGVIEPLIDGLESKFHRDDIQSCIGGKVYVQNVHSMMDKSNGQTMSSPPAQEKKPVFEEILYLDDHAIRALLKLTGKRELMYALKGASEELQEKFLANMSLSVSKMLRHTMGHLQKITAKEIHDAQKHILQRARNLDEE